MSSKNSKAPAPAPRARHAVDPRASAPAPTTAPAPTAPPAVPGAAAARAAITGDDSEIIGKRMTASQKAKAAEVVGVEVPRSFRLTLDDGETVDIAAGTQKLPRGQAEHWYAQAHGVTLAK